MGLRSGMRGMSQWQEKGDKPISDIPRASTETDGNKGNSLWT